MRAVLPDFDATVGPGFDRPRCLFPLSVRRGAGPNNTSKAPRERGVIVRTGHGAMTVHLVHFVLVRKPPK